MILVWTQIMANCKQSWAKKDAVVTSLVIIKNKNKMRGMIHPTLSFVYL